MDHLSFFWVSPDRDKYLRSLETEFYKRAVETVRVNRLTLPPLPDTILSIQRASQQADTTMRDIALLLMEDPSLSGAVLKAANSALFAPRATGQCKNIQTAVSRLGVDRVLGIITATAIYQLKSDAMFSRECNALLKHSAQRSREFAAAMALVTQTVRNYCDEPLAIEPEKALIVGLLADIGLYCVIGEFQRFVNQGHYLKFDIAEQVFFSLAGDCSRLVLKQWQFDRDFIEVAINNKLYTKPRPDITYLDVARMANHLLMFRRNDDAIEEHDVEITASGADALYELSNLDDHEFSRQLNQVIEASSI
ncbi:HDOD domain-containing protein [Salinivibrio sp. ES.052]|uniref:HDOD domain-containing protein n=1 Tax=Salinivibrio sp. ES.052 TaxID=1882823 RepID=UPI00092A245B|nr:HDOD domain-containing protein [Salinivibrio sp. ES.052]SIN80698.1 HD-like signal output (HDOD) domain, no enzymatic activity [Salinivibrio sp. ES.052]